MALGRRRFLASAMVAATAAALEACTGDSKRVSAPSATTVSAGTPHGAPVPSPRVETRSTATAALSPELQRFLTLSAVLTGVAQQQLDAEPARVYLGALQNAPAGGMPLAQLEQVAGIGGGTSPGFDQLTAAGILSRPDAKVTADAIGEYWYRGQAPAGTTGDAGAATKVNAAYATALGWKALSFAAAPATCAGTFGFWSARPAS